MSRLRMLLLLVATAGAPAHALDALDEFGLQGVRGQSGITLLGDLRIEVGSFRWVDTDAEGGSLTLAPMHVQGLLLRQVDVVPGLPAEVQAAMPALVPPQSDVRQVSYPYSNLSSALMPSVTIEAITLGHSDNSLGALQINRIDLQGSRYWNWTR